MSESHEQTLAERIILVTGAGGAIGGAAARAFAADGATVVLLGRTLPPLERTYDAIVDAGHPQPLLCPLDLAAATEDNIDAVAHRIGQEFGRLDGLMHAAATLGSLTPIEHYDLELWQRVLTVNLTTPMLLTRACLPLLKAAADASVIFCTSEIGHHGRAYWGAYGIAQAGIENLVQILADELETNTAIRVNCIDPGPIRSRLRALAYPGEDPNTLPTADSVIPAYRYLMGPEGKQHRGIRLKAQDLHTIMA